MAERTTLTQSRARFGVKAVQFVAALNSLGIRTADVSYVAAYLGLTTVASRSPWLA